MHFSNQIIGLNTKQEVHLRAEAPHNVLNCVIKKQSAWVIWLLIAILTIVPCTAIERSGNYNTFYQIPYAIGERIREWDSLDVILKDEPSLIHWSYNYNVDFLNNIWVADPTLHIIYYISKEKQSWNAKFKIAGNEGAPGRRNGNIVKASFNGPQSLVVFDASFVRQKEAQDLRPVYLSGENAQSDQCKYAT